MNRQVDVKALISHIVRGDGTDRCRICMGETSEGQVYLGDTVMMDGEKPVTLSEIVESLTGVEVPLDQDLPQGLCPQCSASALAAAAFRTLVCQSSDLWSSSVNLLEALPDPQNGPDAEISAILGDKVITVLYKVERFETKKEIGKGLVAKPEILRSKVKKIKTEHSIVAKYWQCPNCDKGFSSPKKLYEHFVDSTDLQRACFICASIMTRNELLKHLKSVHGRDVYACMKCPALLFNLRQFDTHIDKSHATGALSCGDCGRRFTNTYAFNGHTSMHNVKNCPSCDKLFRNHRCYVHHVKNCCNLDMSRHDTHRTKSKVLFEVKNATRDKKVKVGARGSADSECICDYCNKKFAGKKFVCAHIQIVHLKNTHRPCPFCGKSLAAAHMSQHMKSHQKAELFSCERCGLTLKTKLGFVQHLRLHTGEKPYPCQHCGETFSASSRRSEHIRKAHRNKDQIVLKHACQLCPAKFRLPFSLKKHMRTVHDNKIAPGQEYECPDCLIKFSSCRGMLYHRRTHQT